MDSDKNNDVAPRITGRVDTISGGITRGGDTSNARMSPIITNFVVARMLVDTGSLADILYLQAYDQLGLPRKHLKPVSTPLTRFTGHSVYPTGIAELDLTVGKAPRTTTARASFTVGIFWIHRIMALSEDLSSML
ncbi:hypothetical protein LIER_21143 [Lithospermum erythrorhizon]|uniref:Uncharacterized protein n=1 Tax=Lithospermum erythrorhizon TaxID=34254 RepID=A0AAV3QP77_LITER